MLLSAGGEHLAELLLISESTHWHLSCSITAHIYIDDELKFKMTDD